MAKLELKPYQVDAVRAGLAALETHRSAMLVMATGLGKTIVFCTIAKRFLPGRRVLVLAHRDELIQQARDKAQEWLDPDIIVGVEKAQSTFVAPIGRPQVIVASVDSLRQPKRLAAYERDCFGLVVVDECHHAVSASYRKILDHFAPAKVLGVTATPNRHDRKALGQIFECAPYSLGLGEAIRAGWLTPLRQMRVVVDSLDFSKVRTTAGDLNEKDLERILIEEQHLHAVAAPALEHLGARQTLVFATSRRHAHDLTAMFNRLRKGSAFALDGATDLEVRSDKLKEFRDGEFQFLVNCALFVEGFDMAPLSGLVIARPTKSAGFYSQMLGRVTRLSPETGKVDGFVLDFVGNSGRHRLVTALDVLGGDLEPRILAEAQLVADQGVPLTDAVDRARRKVEEEDARRRESAIADEQRRGIVGKVKSHLVEEVSGFELYGFDPGRAQASALIEKAIARVKGKLATRKQVRFLAKHLVDARNMRFQDASNLIDAIKRNGWKAPKNRPRGGPPPLPRPPPPPPRRRRPPLVGGPIPAPKTPPAGPPLSVAAPVEPELVQ